MHKPAKINAVYFELRKQLLECMPAYEILQHAKSLIDIYEKESNPNFDLRTGGIPFENWALDSAFSDGGWRILSHELKCGTLLDCDEWEGFESDLLEGKIDLEMMMRMYSYE